MRVLRAINRRWRKGHDHRRSCVPAFKVVRYGCQLRRAGQRFDSAKERRSKVRRHRVNRGLDGGWDVFQRVSRYSTYRRHYKQA